MEKFGIQRLLPLLLLLSPALHAENKREAAEALIQHAAQLSDIRGEGRPLSNCRLNSQCCLNQCPQAANHVTCRSQKDCGSSEGALGEVAEGKVAVTTPRRLPPKYARSSRVSLHLRNV